MSFSEHPYHRSLAPMMWVFVGLASIELVVVHFLVALWDWRVALVLSLVSLTGVVWLVGIILSFRQLPVVIGDGMVRLRAGRLKAIDLPLAQIADVRSDWIGSEAKGPGVRNLALIAYPNILIELRAPLHHEGRAVHRIGHRFDDPSTFRAVFAAVMARGGEPRGNS